MSVTTTIRVELDDTSIPVTVHGGGPAILVVPGGAAAADGYFPELVETLSSTCAVIVHDRVGTGATASRHTGPDHLARQASDLRTVIDAAGRGPAVVVAHSLGGPVSVQLALDHPDRVNGLVLLDPTLIAPAGEVAKIISGLNRIVPMLRTPGVGHAMAFLIRRTLARQIRGSNDSAAVRRAATLLDAGALINARPLVTHFAADAALLAKRLRSERLSAPGVLVSAQKGARRSAHEEMAALAGLELRPRADLAHIMHLQQPSFVIELVRAAIQAAAGSR